MTDTWAQRIGTASMEFIDELRDKYGDDITVGTICLVVDVIADTPNGPINPIALHSDDPRRWVQLAILGEAREQAEMQNEARMMEADEAEAGES